MALRAVKGLFPQGGEDGGRQAFALISRGNSDAFADLAVQTAGGGDFITVHHADGKLDAVVIAQTVGKQKCLQRIQHSALKGASVNQFHGITSFNIDSITDIFYFEK